MVELAEIFRHAGPAYRQAFGERMLPSHRRALEDIVLCRIPALGGSLYECDDCGALDFAYHSCRNRHCPKCQQDRAQLWLERLRSRLLPCGYSLLTFTPHAHLLVTAGGLSPSATTWVKPAHRRFLLPGYALSQIFRAKLRDALLREGLHHQVDPGVWKKSWTVHVKKVGNGEQAALYLSRYVYRVALSNHRIERFENGCVTFRYTHARTQQIPAH